MDTGIVPPGLLRHSLRGLRIEFEDSPRNAKLVSLTIIRKARGTKPEKVMLKADVSMSAISSNKPQCYPPEVGSITPTIKSKPGMNATWRLRNREAPTTVTHLTYWDLCEIGQLLAQGFLRYDTWGYWSISHDTSYIQERPMYRIAGAGSDVCDRRVAEDIMHESDVLILNEFHNYWITKQLPVGKRMVLYHHGCFHRDKPGKYERAETEAGYARIVSTPDLLLYGKTRYNRNKQWVPSPLDVEELDRLYNVWRPRRANERVTVGHCYTIKENKGTDDFEAIARAVEGRFDLALWHRVQRRQSLYYLSQCDIYFASFLFCPGLATLEAMAMGIPAMAGFGQKGGVSAESVIDRYKQEIGEDELPFIVVTQETCGKLLRDLVNDAGLRAHWAAKGRAYIDKWHSLPAVTARMKSILENVEPCRFVVQN